MEITSLHDNLPIVYHTQTVESNKIKSTNNNFLDTAVTKDRKKNYCKKTIRHLHPKIPTVLDFDWILGFSRIFRVGFELG
jgi:hypothetical protein